MLRGRGRGRGGGQDTGRKRKAIADPKALLLTKAAESRLSEEALIQIFTFLHPDDICSKVIVVSNRWYKIAKGEACWYQLCCVRWGFEVWRKDERQLWKEFFNCSFMQGRTEVHTKTRTLKHQISQLHRRKDSLAQKLTVHHQNKTQVYEGLNEMKEKHGLETNKRTELQERIEEEAKTCAHMETKLAEEREKKMKGPDRELMSLSISELDSRLRRAEEDLESGKKRSLRSEKQMMEKIRVMQNCKKTMLLFADIQKRIQASKEKQKQMTEVGKKIKKMQSDLEMHKEYIRQSHRDKDEINHIIEHKVREVRRRHRNFERWQGPAPTHLLALREKKRIERARREGREIPEPKYTKEEGKEGHSEAALSTASVLQGLLGKDATVHIAGEDEIKSKEAETTSGFDVSSLFMPDKSPEISSTLQKSLAAMPSENDILKGVSGSNKSEWTKNSSELPANSKEDTSKADAASQERSSKRGSSMPSRHRPTEAGASSQPRRVSPNPSSNPAPNQPTEPSPSNRTAVPQEDTDSKDLDKQLQGFQSQLQSSTKLPSEASAQTQDIPGENAVFPQLVEILRNNLSPDDLLTVLQQLQQNLPTEPVEADKSSSLVYDTQPQQQTSTQDQGVTPTQQTNAWDTVGTSTPAAKAATWYQPQSGTQSTAQTNYSSEYGASKYMAPTPQSHTTTSAQPQEARPQGTEQTAPQSSAKAESDLQDTSILQYGRPMEAYGQGAWAASNANSNGASGWYQQPYQPQPQQSQPQQSQPQQSQPQQSQQQQQQQGHYYPHQQQQPQPYQYQQQQHAPPMSQGRPHHPTYAGTYPTPAPAGYPVQFGHYNSRPIGFGVNINTLVGQESTWQQQNGQAWQNTNSQ